MRNFIPDLSSTTCLYLMLSRVKEPSRIDKLKQNVLRLYFRDRKVSDLEHFQAHAPVFLC